VKSRYARRGVISCVVSLSLLSCTYRAKVVRTATIAIRLMYPATAFLAFTSATVVNALTSAASLQCNDDLNEVVLSGREGKLEMHAELKKGRASGKSDHRASQLGRAVGPLLAYASYCLGPSTTYLACSFAMITHSARMGRLIQYNQLPRYPNSISRLVEISASFCRFSAEDALMKNQMIGCLRTT